MDNVHRLEVPEAKPAGLIIKKNEDDSKATVFKIPKSKFGLDQLAAKLKRERESGLRLSFKDQDNDIIDDDIELNIRKTKATIKNYRSAHIETPSYSGGVTKSVREHFNERINDKKSKGIYYSSKNTDKERKAHKSSSRDRERADKKRRNESKSSRRDRTSNRHRGDPETPREEYSGSATKSSISKSTWDDDDDEDDYSKTKRKRSTWDFPTPSNYRRRPDDSVRSYRSVKAASSRSIEDDTPRATPAHKYNEWAADRKHSGATPRLDKNSESKQPWESQEDRDFWEEEQLRLDREWYNMDEGYDDENNPFVGTSADYLKKREEQLELRKKKRISAQQRQINKDNELWEKNRMFTSGVVTSLNVSEDFEEETVERVHLLVHHTIPPFLDGRIVFTKVMGNYFLSILLFEV